MSQVISKSQFKPKVLEYLRRVEESKQPLIITHQGKPVVQIAPYSKNAKELLKTLRNTVLEYKKPTQPVAQDTCLYTYSSNLVKTTKVDISFKI